jgi:hypothetical protein
MRKLSETVAERLADTEVEMTSLLARQEALTAEKSIALAAPTLDPKVLAKIEQEEHRITSLLDSLHMRCGLLSAQREEAETEEAVARIHAIEGEYESLRLRMEAHYITWMAGIAALLAILKESGQDRAQARLLIDEGAYLHERHNAPHASLPPAPFLSQDDITVKLADEFRKAALMLQTTSPWREKADQLRQQKNAAAARGQDPRRVATQVRMNTPPFTAGTTPKT